MITTEAFRREDNQIIVRFSESGKETGFQAKLTVAEARQLRREVSRTVRWRRRALRLRSNRRPTSARRRGIALLVGGATFLDMDFLVQMLWHYPHHSGGVLLSGNAVAWTVLSQIVPAAVMISTGLITLVDDASRPRRK